MAMKRKRGDACFESEPSSTPGSLRQRRSEFHSPSNNGRSYSSMRSSVAFGTRNAPTVVTVKGTSKKRQNILKSMDVIAEIECREVFTKLKSHQYGPAFEKGVADSGNGMAVNLTAIQSRSYTRVEDFVADVRSVFYVAKSSFPVRDPMQKTTSKLSEYFEAMWKETEKRLNPIITNKGYNQQKGDEKQNSPSTTINGFQSMGATPTSVLCQDKAERAEEKKRSLNEKLQKKGQVVSSSNVCASKSSAQPQMSDPKRAERTAMMKYRFADIILKAQKSTLSRGDEAANKRLEKENFRMKRECLELTRKNEREKERAAARLALEKMTESVEIDDNFKTLRDFEALLGIPLI